MSLTDTDGGYQILVELAPEPGVRHLGLPADNLAARSATAIDNAMVTVKRMADRFGTVVDDLAGNPDEIEVAYGITFNFEGQALIAKAGVEAALQVTITWKREGGVGE